MLKETETEETLVFFVTFLSLVEFQLGGRAPLAPLATPMDEKIRGIIVKNKCFLTEIVSFTRFDVIFKGLERKIR